MTVTSNRELNASQFSRHIPISLAPVEVMRGDLPLSSRRPSSSSSLRSLVKSAGNGNNPHRRRRALSVSAGEGLFPNGQGKILVLICFLMAALLLPIVFSGVSLNEIIREANATIEMVEEEVEYVEEEINVDPKIANASWQSTAKLLSAMFLGVLTSYAGILDSAAVQALARLTYYVFMPALMLVSVNQALSKADSSSSSAGISSSSLLIMPAIGVLHVVMGYAFARLLTFIRPSQRSPTDDRDVWMNSSFGNATPLPLVIATSLFPHGHSLASDMTACIAFYTIIEGPIFYTWGADLLLTPGERPPPTKSPMVSVAESFLSLPILASILGIVVGNSLWIQNAIVPGNALAPVYASIETFATAYLPSTILVLAGSMSGGDSSASASASQSDSTVGSANLKTSSLNGAVTSNASRRLLKSHSVELSKGDEKTAKKPTPMSVAPLTVALTCLSRFILMPLATVAFVELLLPSFLVNETPRNKALVSLVILMQGSMPPAQNSALLLTLAKCTDRASRLTKTLTVCYVLSIVPVTIWMSRHLQQTQVLQFIQQANTNKQ